VTNAKSDKHGFFAVMGGLGVTANKEHQWFLDDGRATTPLGVLLMRDLDLLPDLHRKTTRGAATRVYLGAK
jgi:hypothetical protein